MDSENRNENEGKIEIENEIDFARAVTALMMAVQLGVDEIKANRAEFRMNSSYQSFQSDVEKRAS